MITTTVLEANIVRHCSNRCACCNHASPWAKPYTMTPETLRWDLFTLQPILHTAFFCLQGGEPLLHPLLLKMMRVAFESGVADRYGILTNGNKLADMDDEFWELCSEQEIELRHSVYPNLGAGIVEHAAAKAKEFKVNYRPVPTGQFLKVLGNYPNGESFYECPWSTCHTVHEGHFFICPIAAFWPERFMGLPWNVDGLKIQGATESELQRFIDIKQSLQSCTRCTGANAERVEWHECANETEWLKDSTV